MLKSQKDLEKELENASHSGNLPSVVRFLLASLGGIPVVGGVFGAGAGTWSEAEQKHFNNLISSWIKLQQDEIKEIGITLAEIMMRVDNNNEEVQKRMESPEYLKLVKKAFRDWSAAESEEKRVLIRNLLTNAATKEQICSDDIISMFLVWVDRYNEGHFKIIREIYKNPGTTRHEIWQVLNGRDVREDSAEADLFKLLIHDLSLGRVIRQHREVDYQGNFIKNRTRKSRGNTIASAFDDEKDYELTELGQWFVHYTMNEVVSKISHME